MINYKNVLDEKKFFIFICPSQHVKVHSHNFLEFAYVLKGKALHTCDGKTVEIATGDYFVVDYKSHHSYTAQTNDFALINFLFMPELIDASLVNCRSLSTLISSYQIHFNDVLFTSNPAENIFKDEDEKIKKILFEMLAEFEQKFPGYLQIIRSKTVELLVETMRKICLNTEDEKSDAPIETILKFVRYEYMNDITLSDVCKKFGYAFTYLSAKLKKESGLSFTQHLQKIRIEQSLRLLINSDKSINEIAALVGYKDIKSFYTVFKRIANTTPAKFRKNYKKGT